MTRNSKLLASLVAASAVVAIEVRGVEIDVTQISAMGIPSAVADDDSDDSPAFNFAGLNPGDTVLVPAGTYHLDANTFIRGDYRPERGALVVPRFSTPPIPPNIPESKTTLEFRGGVTAGPWAICDEVTGPAPGICTFGAIKGQKTATIYAEWWGAIGDDELDDTSAIQRAVEEAAVSGALQGLPVIYDICDLSVGGASNFIWRGTGWSSGGVPYDSVAPDGQTIYRATSSCNKDLVRFGETGGAFSNGVFLRSIGFDGNRDNNLVGHCISLENTLWFSMEHVSAFHCAEDGIHGKTVNQAIFSQVRASENNGDGVHLAEGSDNALLLNLDAEGNVGAGLRISGGCTGGPGTIISPYFEDNDIGFVNDSTSCVQVIGGRESQSATAGVHITSVATCTTIDSMSFFSASPKLLVESGASGTMLRGILDSLIDDQAALNHTASFSRRPDGTWRLSGVQYEFPAVPAGGFAWMLCATLAVVAYRSIRRHVPHQRDPDSRTT